MTRQSTPFSAGMINYASYFTIPPGKPQHPIQNQCCYSGFEILKGFAFRVHTHALGRSAPCPCPPVSCPALPHPALPLLLLVHDGKLITSRVYKALVTCLLACLMQCSLQPSRYLALAGKIVIVIIVTTNVSGQAIAACACCTCLVVALNHLLIMQPACNMS